MADQRLVQVGHRQIAMTEIGSGNALIMLHGGGPGTTALSTFSRNAVFLARRFRVILPDMPGFGASSGYGGVDHADPFRDLAGAIDGLLDTLELEAVSLIGHSLGGAVALQLAMDRPERVKRLVLIAPGGVGTTRFPLAPTAGLRKLLGYYAGDGPTEAKLATFMRDYLVFDRDAISDAMISERYKASLDSSVIADPPLQRPAGTTAILTLFRMDLTRNSRLTSIDTPTLVIWGRDDRVNRPRGATILAKKLRRCDLYLPTKTGHWVQWERAALFNAIATEYLEPSP